MNFAIQSQVLVQKLQKINFFNYCETIAKLLQNYCETIATFYVRIPAGKASGHILPASWVRTSLLIPMGWDQAETKTQNKESEARRTQHAGDDRESHSSAL